MNLAWDEPFHVVRLEANGDILRIPPGTFHRSVSDEEGSLVMNQAVRTAQATVASEFRVYNSEEIPLLYAVTPQAARKLRLQHVTTFETFAMAA